MDYNKYYQKLIIKNKERKNELPNRKVFNHRNRKYHTDAFSYQGFKYNFVISSQRSSVFGENFQGFIVELYIDSAQYHDSYFNQLQEYQEGIERELDIENIIWQGSQDTENGTVCRIFAKKIADIEDESKWDECIDWQLDTMIRFLKVFPKYTEMLNKTRSVVMSEEEFRKKYKSFVKTLPLQNSGKYAKLYTESQNKPFKVNKNSSGSIVVRAFTQQSSPMVISANQLAKVLFNNDRYLYSSYEPVLINRIDNELMINMDEVVEDIVEPNPLPGSDNNKIKNIILYGSPGVGKTHNIKKLISLIESGVSEKEIFETIKNNEQNNGIDIDNIKDRVNFITFHQSFGYEDFIEGFRPNKEGKIELQNGVFKIICEKAQKNLDDSSKDISTLENEYNLKASLNRFVEDFIQKEEKVYLTKSVYINYIDDESFYYSSDSGGMTNAKIPINDLLLCPLYDMQNLNDIKNLNELSGTSRQRPTYLYELYKLFNKFEKRENNKSIEVEKVERKNYYLIIDEINRGNISKIFGELITLIEEDKRDTLEVTLPYSKKSFKIPSNLYIIGTMNSTDKSIALIDIALRRRFTFLKMEPKLDLVNNVKAKNIMKQLNEKITETLGADYVLGHSYFMKIENDDDLDFVLEYKIKPLLEEYFYGDDRLGDVLDIAQVNKVDDVT